MDSAYSKSHWSHTETQELDATTFFSQGDVYILVLKGSLKPL